MDKSFKETVDELLGITTPAKDFEEAERYARRKLQMAKEREPDAAHYDEYYLWEYREENFMEQYKHIPASLKQLKQWVCFKLEYNEKKGKYDKIPKDPKTGYNAKANDPATWGDFQTAVKAVSKYGFDGIGIEFANGIFGVDFIDRLLKGQLILRKEREQ